MTKKKSKECPILPGIIFGFCFILIVAVLLAYIVIERAYTKLRLEIAPLKTEIKDLTKQVTDLKEADEARDKQRVFNAFQFWSITLSEAETKRFQVETNRLTDSGVKFDCIYLNSTDYFGMDRNSFTFYISNSRLVVLRRAGELECWRNNKRINCGELCYEYYR